MFLMSHPKKLKGKPRATWEQYFDARIRAGAPTKKQGGMIRVEDLVGNWFQRDGSPCCGCGYHAQAENLDQYDVAPNIKGWEPEEE